MDNKCMCFAFMLLLMYLQSCCCNAVSGIRNTVNLLSDVPSQGPLKHSIASMPTNKEILTPDSRKGQFEDEDSWLNQYGQLRYGKRNTRLRFSVQTAPRLRYGKLLLQQMRYRKEAVPHLRYGKEVEDPVWFGKEAAHHLRYGKEAPQDWRYGKEAYQHVRYGKETAQNLGYGKEAAQHLRYGKETAPHVRYGKEVAPHFRYGKEIKDHTRYGKVHIRKEDEQQLRYGKESTDDLESMLMVLAKNGNRQKEHRIKEEKNHVKDDVKGAMLMHNLILQKLVKSEEEQTLLNILRLLKELDRRAAKAKAESRLKLERV